MIHEKIFFDNDKNAFLEVYALDKSIGHNVSKKWPAVIICPGGAYLISAVKEGEAVAMQFLNQGYSCFVLRYSTFLADRDTIFNDKPDININGYYPTQILQLMETIHLIKKNAEVWNVDVDNLFAIGFSAGAHIVGTIGTRWSDKVFLERLPFKVKNEEMKLAGVMLCYPMLTGPLKNHNNPDVIKQGKLMELCLFGHNNPEDAELEQLKLSNFVTKDTIPMFLWHTNADKVTDSSDTIDFVKKLKQYDVPCEFHLFMDGQHGLACSNEMYAKSKKDVNENVAMWLPLAFNWLKLMRERK